MAELSKSEQTTLQYYDTHADDFAGETVDVAFQDMQERFLKWVPAGSEILDFGCGAGRDTKYFLSRGYQVDAVDGSESLCRIASSYTGIPVRHMYFQDLEAVSRYGGIWACSSILHVPKKDLPEIFRRMERALVPGGVLYVSFKYGTFEGERNGRYFTDLDEDGLGSILSIFPDLAVLEEWISLDARPGRSSERWLNALVQKGRSAS